MQTLYKHLKEREAFRMRFNAKLHGAKFEDESHFKDVQSGKEVTLDTVLFKDPKEYKNMSDEERQSETERMVKLTKRWAKGSGLGE